MSKVPMSNVLYIGLSTEHDNRYDMYGKYHLHMYISVYSAWINIKLDIISVSVALFGAYDILLIIISTIMMQFLPFLY